MSPEKISDSIKNRIDRRLKESARLADTGVLTDIFDRIGFRRSLTGYATMINAAREYMATDTGSMCRTTYKTVICRISGRYSVRWTDNQLKYLLISAQKSGKFRNFGRLIQSYNGNTVDSRETNGMTPAEFLSLLRAILYSRSLQTESTNSD